MTSADEKRIAEDRRRELTAWEKANDRVPGTASWKKGGGQGGQDWAGRARMAAARLAAGIPLDRSDEVALARDADSRR